MAKTGGTLQTRTKGYKMSTLIAGTDSGVSITRYARGVNISNLGYGYQVTWRKKKATDFCSLDFDDEEKARAFYHLVHLSIDIA